MLWAPHTADGIAKRLGFAEELLKTAGWSQTYARGIMKTKGSVHLGEYPEQHQEICIKFLHKYASEGRNPQVIVFNVLFCTSVHEDPQQTCSLGWLETFLFD